MVMICAGQQWRKARAAAVEAQTSSAGEAPSPAGGKGEGTTSTEIIVTNSEYTVFHGTHFWAETQIKQILNTNIIGPVALQVSEILHSVLPFAYAALVNLWC